MIANVILDFIQQWVPSLGVIVAGIWVLFQWLFGEQLRRLKEMPALDGGLSAKIIPLDHGRSLVTVEALWNNRSPLPVKLDFKHCKIDIFDLTRDTRKESHPVILKKDLGTAVCSDFFLVGICKIDYVLEPNTASTMTNHFILDPGIYGVRMELRTFKANEHWWKEMIVNTRDHKLADKTL